MAELAFGVERRPSQYDKNLLVLLLDTSGSMRWDNGRGEPRIAELQRAVTAFLDQDIQEVAPLWLNGEIAIGGFSGDTLNWYKLGRHKRRTPFVPAAEVTWRPKLKPGSATPMADAIFAAVETLRAHRTQLAEEGYRLRYTPLMYMITDGQPSEGQDMAGARRLLQETAFRTPSPEFLFVPIGVFEAGDEEMRQLAASYVPLRDKTLRDVLKFVTRSASATMHPVERPQPKTARHGVENAHESLPPEYGPIQKVLDTYGDYVS